MVLRFAHFAIMVFRLLQLKNAFLPIFLRLLGRVIFLSFLHPEKASSPIETKPSPMVKEVRFVRFLKAPAPISVTVSDTTMPVILALFEKVSNAPDDMEVMVYVFPSLKETVALMVSTPDALSAGLT